MKGHIIVENNGGRRHIYVPEAHIQFYAILNGQERWIVCAFRTDGYYGRTRENAIPTVEHLRQAYQFTKELEVPEHLVKFAVESERRRQESVAGIEEVLQEAVKTGNRQAEFRALISQLSSEKSDDQFGEDVEHKIGQEVDALITKTGGLQ